MNRNEKSRDEARRADWGAVRASVQYVLSEGRLWVATLACPVYFLYLHSNP